jgi:hypothetical protein
MHHHHLPFHSALVNLTVFTTLSVTIPRTMIWSCLHAFFLFPLEFRHGLDSIVKFSYISLARCLCLCDFLSDTPHFFLSLSHFSFDLFLSLFLLLPFALRGSDPHFVSPPLITFLRARSVRWLCVGGDESKSQAGSTALICAIHSCRRDCEKLLIDAGADKEAKDNVRAGRCLFVALSVLLLVSDTCAFALSCSNYVH